MTAAPLVLRGYQERGIAALLGAFLERGRRRVLFVLPTGGGKTEVAAALFARAGGRGLFLTHRLELVDQAAARVARYGLRVGVIQGDTPPDPDAPVQVASVATLARRAEMPHADLVITDEAHHAVAASFAEIIAAYPSARHVGLTATPYRLDGRGLGNLFEEIVVGARADELVELGFLVAPRIYTAPPPDLAGVGRTAGDFALGPLAERMTRLAGDVVAHWQRHGGEASTVVFAVDIAHSRALTARFLEAGAAAEHFDSSDSRVDRAAVLERFRAGATRVVSNCMLISEGFDMPEIGCVVMARPTESRALYNQMAGRAMRPAVGKADCILLDNAGNYGRHGHPLDPEIYALDDAVRVARSTPTRTCRGCFAIIPAGAPRCPYCGEAAPPAAAREVEESDATLVAVEALRARYDAMTHAERVAVYRGLLLQAASCGYRAGWAAHRYRTRFGVWPEAAVAVEAEAGTVGPAVALSQWLRTARERGYKEGWAMYRYRTKYGQWPSRALMAEARRMRA